MTYWFHKPSNISWLGVVVRNNLIVGHYRTAARRAMELVASPYRYELAFVSILLREWTSPGFDGSGLPYITIYLLAHLSYQVLPSKEQHF
jgi:hypothetical protein